MVVLLKTRPSNTYPESKSNNSIPYATRHPKQAHQKTGLVVARIDANQITVDSKFPTKFLLFI